MRELADRSGFFVAHYRWIRWTFEPVRKRRQRHRTERHKWHLVPVRLRVVMTPVAPGLIARHVCGPELRFRIRSSVHGKLDERSKARIVLVVILLDDQRAVRELRLKMKSVWCAAVIECTHQRRPARAVRIDRPQSPKDVAPQSLRFERAEHDAP